MRVAAHVKTAAATTEAAGRPVPARANPGGAGAPATGARNNRSGYGSRWSGVCRSAIGVGARENPGRRLTVPDERVAHDHHVVFHAEIDISIGRAEIIAVSAFARMNAFPFQIVLGGDLIVLLLHHNGVFVNGRLEQRRDEPFRSWECCG